MNVANGVKMKKKFDNVYQFKIVLKGVKPAIWRRIQVPETYNFWDLHIAIQDVMGWLDYHLHSFYLDNHVTGEKIRIGIVLDEPDTFDDFDVITENGQYVSNWFLAENTAAIYLYDFGDSWEHEVRLEKILPKEKGVSYPRCVGGERACPPEDCGGAWGFEHLLEVILDPNHEEYEDLTEWLGGGFDPEHFSVQEIEFDDPDKRWKSAFGQD
jgi:hypothetical protein